MPTPHNNAQKGDFAKTVLMPGDPLRAEFIANTFLENPRKVTGVRGMYGFTGTYHGKPISVMGSGMGMPSIGIYSYELYHEYGVENIIRIGSGGNGKLCAVPQRPGAGQKGSVPAHDFRQLCFPRKNHCRTAPEQLYQHDEDRAFAGRIKQKGHKYADQRKISYRAGH